MKDLTLPTPPVTVRVLDTAIWIESDMFGAWHVVVQHEGMDAFTFATFNYRYGYTDNASTHAAAVQMAIDLGATEPVEERQRGDNFADAILAIRNGEVEYKSWEPVSHHEDGGRAATDKKSARDTALEQAANLVECEYAADATQGRRLAQIAQHIRDLKKRNQS